MDYIKRLSAWFSDARRIAALFDKSAWLLMAPAALVLYLIDPVMLKTILQWSGVALVLSGAAIMISRIIFPQIHLSDLVDQAKNEKSLPAAIIAAALMLFVSLLILALIVWAKA